MNRPGENWEERSYKSLERPAEYFGCHIEVGIAAIVTAMASLLSFLFTDFGTGVAFTFAGVTIAAGIVKVGMMASSHDSFWPEALMRHVLDGDDYLDV